MGLRAFLSFSIVVAVAAIWAPVGLGALPQIEDWEFFGIFQQAGPTFVVTGPQFVDHIVRPLFLLPFAAAFLVPASPLAMHALLALALIGKGLGMAMIAWWLTRDRLITLIGAVLFVLYPADTMQMGFRALGIVCASALAALAVGLVLVAAERRSPLPACAAGAAILTAGLMYEAALLMGLAPLILWLARCGLRRGFQDLASRWSVVLIWSLALAANVVYIAWVYRPSGYQGHILANTQSLTLAAWHLAMTGLFRVLLQCWVDGWEMFWSNLRYAPYFAAGVVLVGLTWRRMSLAKPIGVDSAGAEPIGQRDGRGIPIAIAGVLIAAIGYLPYLLSISHVMITQRTYLFPAIGGTIFVIGLLNMVTWRRPQLVSLLGVTLIAAGLGCQWEQLAHYTELSNRGRMYLSALLPAASDVASRPGKTLLVTDRTGALGNTWMLRGDVLQLALTYLVGSSVDVVVCEAPSNILSSFAMAPHGQPGHCRISADGWSIGEDLPNGRRLSSGNVVQISIDRDGRATQPGGEGRPPSDGQMARWRAVLGCFPCTYEPRFAAGASYRYDFGRWWSLEDVPWGDGWRDAEWVPLPAGPRSTAWMIEPQSTLLFRLVPGPGDYQLRVRLGASISPEARDTLTVAVNGERLAYDWSSSDTLVASVKRDWLRFGTNELQFAARSNTPYGISNSVDWIEIAPVTP